VLKLEERLRVVQQAHGPDSGRYNCRGQCGHWERLADKAMTSDSTPMVWGKMGESCSEGVTSVRETGVNFSNMSEMQFVGMDGQ
jgi:hypothetical protein